MQTTEEMLRVLRRENAVREDLRAAKFAKLTPRPGCGQVTVRKLDEDDGFVPGVTPHRDQRGRFCSAE